MYKNTECERHPDNKKRLFCKEDSCWISICTYCAEENHKSHQVVDKVLLQAEIKAESERRKHECLLLSNTLKGVLKEIDFFAQKISKKQKKVASEEKKLESNIIKQIQQTCFDMDRQKNQLIKKANNAMTTIQNQKAELDKEIENISGKADSLLSKGSDEDIKRFMSKGEIPPYLKDNSFQELKNRIEKETDSFERISILETFIDTLRPPKRNKSPRLFSAERASSRERLVKMTPKTPKLEEMSRKKNSLEELCNKIKEKNLFLQELETKIEIKEKDLNRLEKSKAQLVASNTEKLTQMEKKNKELSLKLGNILPERKSQARSTHFLTTSLNCFSPRGNNMNNTMKGNKTILYDNKKPLEEAQKTLEAELGKLNIEIKSHTLDGLLFQLIEIVDKCYNKEYSTAGSMKNQDISPNKHLKDKVNLLESQVSKLTKELRSAQVMYSSKN